MRILGIETSCDETAAAVVDDGKTLLSNVVATQIDIHKKYGGVVPEIAARSHIEAINPVIDEALEKANTTWDKIDAIAVTNGPGLSGSLLIGTLAARTLALTKNKPLYPVNHVIGHIYANFLVDPQPQFPMLALIVSGGHSQFALFHNHLEYVLLGQTQDDAVGEAYDKVAKIIGLPYPGGPSIEKTAANGNPYVYDFPKARMPKREIVIPGEWMANHEPLDDVLRDESDEFLDGDKMRGGNEERSESYQTYGERAPKQPTKQIAPSVVGVGGNAGEQSYTVKNSYDFSFSGLKTAVLRKVQAECGKDYNFPSFELSELLTPSQRDDFAASFNRIAVETLVDKTMLAFTEFAPKSVVIAGGVAASRELRRQLTEALPIPIEYADMTLCTDNAAMIATLGFYEAQQQNPSDPHLVGVHPNMKM